VRHPNGCPEPLWGVEHSRCADDELAREVEPCRCQNAEVAAMFDQAAELLEIQGENPFRVRAYRRAARVIETLPQSVRSMLPTGADLSELPGSDADRLPTFREAYRKRDAFFRSTVSLNGRR
jgi:Helix-hairpin-helix domain